MTSSGAASTGRRPRWRSASTRRRWAIVNVHARNSRSPPSKLGQPAHDLQEDLAGGVLGLGGAVRAQVADDLRSEVLVDPRPRPLGARAGGREHVVERIASGRMTVHHRQPAAAGDHGRHDDQAPRPRRCSPRRPCSPSPPSPTRRPTTSRPRSAPRSPASTPRRRSRSSCRAGSRSTTTAARSRPAAAGATRTASRSRARRNCGANACFLVSFGAERGGTPSFRRTVKLRGGRTGYFKPLTCGGSCSPPIIEWKSRGNLYRIQAKIPDSTDAGQQRRMVAAANSAIGAGPR